MGKVYRLGQLTLIEEKAIELLTYVRSYDKEPLPKCFDFLKLIIHNIAADKVDDFKEIEELSSYIEHDGKSLYEMKTGLPEYHIEIEEEEKKIEVNEKLDVLKTELKELLDIDS